MRLTLRAPCGKIRKTAGGGDMEQYQDCGFYIKHINDALQKDANNTLRQEDLTLAQVSVLLELEGAPEGQLPLKELEKRLRVAQSTAAGIVVRLEQKGFAQGAGDPEDRRVKMVRITPAGLACCANARENVRRTEEHLLSGLTAEERLTFAALLKKVSENLE